MRVLRASDRAAVAWKNGGGLTREVCAVPETAGFDFDWRLSIAEVTAGGPFSSFPGVDRTLAVIEGRMRLTIDRQAPTELFVDSPAMPFAGDAAIEAEVLEPVVDVNLMTRRRRYRGTLDRLQLHRGTVIGDPDAETVILALDAVKTSGHALAPLDALWLEPGALAAVAPVTAGARVLVSQIWSVRAPETD